MSLVYWDALLNLESHDGFASGNLLDNDIFHQSITPFHGIVVMGFITPMTRLDMSATEMSIHHVWHQSDTASICSGGGHRAAELPTGGAALAPGMPEVPGG